MKIIHTFFLKIYIFFNLALLHLNNHIGPTIIHHNKSADTYESAMRFIAKKCNLENKITDGEPAMIAVCLKSFSKCSLRRCTRYLEANCKNILMGMNIKGNIKDAMLDVVFSEHVFVGAENKLDLKKKK